MHIRESRRESWKNAGGTETSSWVVISVHAKGNPWRDLSHVSPRRGIEKQYWSHFGRGQVDWDDCEMTKRRKSRERGIGKSIRNQAWPPRRSTCPLRGSRCPVRPTRSSPASSWNASLTLSTRNDDFSEKERRKRNELVTHTDRYTRSVLLSQLEMWSLY